MSNSIDRSIRESSSWHKYQKRMKHADARKRITKKALLYSPLLPLLAIAVFGIIAAVGGTTSWIASSFSDSAGRDSSDTVQQTDTQFLTKKEIQGILDTRNLVNLEKKGLSITTEGRTYHVDTSLQIPLQKYLLKIMDRSNAIYIGIVVMEPTTGKVLAMAGYDKEDRENDPCIDNKFPAASIFKIVTAAAGIEKFGFSANSTFTFNGGKYTLYKYQLKDRNNRYTNHISFRDSFAQSVNPVFGKIGANYLGKRYLEEYADAFGFNQPIDFEIPLPPSRVSISDEAYQWAEIACGFNRDTVMSPLHGALMSAAIVNGGGFVEPTIVEKIIDGEGKICYWSEPKTIGYAVTPQVSKVIQQLMMRTVKSGTSRKAFRGSRKDRVLSKLDIGGKTGSIMSRKKEHVRYDWFVGFAEEKNGEEKLVVSVLVAHEKYIGKRAGYYARKAFSRYFRDYFTTKSTAVHTESRSEKKIKKKV